MSEEEKIIINTLKTFIGNLQIEDTSVLKLQLNKKETKTLLNLIEKQAKEIARLQNIKTCEISKMINDEKVNIYKNYISKDKIREKMNKLSDSQIAEGHIDFMIRII